MFMFHDTNNKNSFCCITFDYFIFFLKIDMNRTLNRNSVLFNSIKYLKCLIIQWSNDSNLTIPLAGQFTLNIIQYLVMESTTITSHVWLTSWNPLLEWCYDLNGACNIHICRWHLSFPYKKYILRAFWRFKYRQNFQSILLFYVLQFNSSLSGLILANRCIFC